MMIKILALVALLAVCHSYPSFRHFIPNGESVPHPCERGGMWPGVGHQSRYGSGARNVFGEDFQKAGQVWSKDLCQKDSDGDGVTNGEELGDPNCIWKRGDTPERAAQSHPGVCEPVDSNKCTAINNFNIADC